MDNLWITGRPGALRAGKLLCLSETPKLPEVCHLLAGIQDGIQLPGARSRYFGVKGRFSAKKISKPGLTRSISVVYTIEETIEREGNVPFLMLLIPLKLLFIILVVQQLLH